MYAQLGGIIFQNLKGFTDQSGSGSVVFAEHQTVSGKSKLQHTGSGLEELSLSMRFQASFCNPSQEFAALKDLRDNAEVLPLLYGNGDVLGNFVIISLEDSIEDADGQGNIFSLLVRASLREYVMPDRIQQQQADNRKNAKAVGDKKPVANKKTNPSPCANTITGIVTKIENHAVSTNSVVLERGGLTTPENRYNILRHLSAARLLDEDLLKRCDDSQSCAFGDAQLKYQAQQVFAAINNFNSVVANRVYSSVNSENQIFQATVRNLKTAARNFVNKSILRK